MKRFIVYSKKERAIIYEGVEFDNGKVAGQWKTTDVRQLTFWESMGDLESIMLNQAPWQREDRTRLYVAHSYEMNVVGGGPVETVVEDSFDDGLWTVRSAGLDI